MRILIDRHVLIWHLEDDARLSSKYSDIIADSDNQVEISIASIWEIAIKISIGKLKLSSPIEDIVGKIEQSSNSILPIHPNHASKLPFTIVILSIA